MSGKPIATIVRKLGWARWRKLDEDLQDVYVAEAETNIAKKGKRIVGKPIPDHHTLLQVAKPHLKKPTKKLGRTQLAKVGAAFVKVVGEIQVSVPEKNPLYQHAKRLATATRQTAGVSFGMWKNCCGADSSFKSMICPVWKPVGRPKGATTIDKGRVFDLLAEQCHDAAKIHLRSGKNMLTFTAPVSVMYDNDEELQSIISYDWLCHLVQGGRGNFSRGKRRVDVCDTCYIWDNEVYGRISGAIKHWIVFFVSMVANYFCGFDGLDNIVKAKRIPVDKPSFLESFQTYVEEHKDIPSRVDRWFFYDL